MPDATAANSPAQSTQNAPASAGRLPKVLVLPTEVPAGLQPK
jgi:hypothetical protein